jgi:hypothetical protein
MWFRFDNFSIKICSNFFVKNISIFRDAKVGIPMDFRFSKPFSVAFQNNLEAFEKKNKSPIPIFVSLNKNNRLIYFLLTCMGFEKPPFPLNFLCRHINLLSFQLIHKQIYRLYSILTAVSTPYIGLTMNYF